jgi:AraC family transcriptional regulator of adaptative response/methylated-DNA-[protein]-cysteine methyltransferase
MGLRDKGAMFPCPRISIMNVSTQISVETDPRWQAVVARDRSKDGQFFYSVKSTGVYCRPSCAARLAKPRNVAFHASCADAEAAGFRPCKRCKPDQFSTIEQQAAKVEAACRLIESAEETPDLAALAESAGFSPFHFHRVFKSITGVTPKAYAKEHRDSRVRDGLRKGVSVTEALYEAGFNSNAPFYQGAKASLGMTPTQYRKGGASAVIRFAIGDCGLGSVLVACSDVGVCAILLGDDPQELLDDLQDRFPRAELIGGDAEFDHLVGKVIALVDQPAIPVELPLDVRGTAFQRKVWQALRAIPAGETRSYSQIAEQLDMPKGARAVARACAANALAVAIPCHRVVKNDGALSGYRWGIERKKKLLALEAAE